MRRAVKWMMYSDLEIATVPSVADLDVLNQEFQAPTCYDSGGLSFCHLFVTSRDGFFQQQLCLLYSNLE